ncbi:MAG: helix-turn-helix transcriptional regulator [Anaerolineaceae bacterium]|nr:helix-turn-helix transcriptional regulator [Anaerolineae bacterium]MCB9460864.1 helix-turn-helix transcriptional regulator [Anaerolineaceae bacterium]
MTAYGQYCPIAQALELLGDRWTLLIIRDMLTGTQHFNDFLHGLPGISRALLAKRLRHLERVGIIEKHTKDSGRKTTEYHLTQSGQELDAIINSLLLWGIKWSFGDPRADQLDPLLLMWWIHDRVNMDELPSQQVVVQFDFSGASRDTYWLVMSAAEVMLCLTDPGYETNVLVSADLATFFKLWLGQIEYEEALQERTITVDGMPRLVQSFPNWFAWSLAAPAVRAARQAAS